MLLTEAGIEHLAAIVLLPKLAELGMAGWKALKWKIGSHLYKGDTIKVNGEEAKVESINLSGLHIAYTEDNAHRTISVSKLESLDVRKMSQHNK